jgi:hypothetical protein
LVSQNHFQNLELDEVIDSNKTFGFFFIAPSILWDAMRLNIRSGLKAFGFQIDLGGYSNCGEHHCVYLNSKWWVYDVEILKPPAENTISTSYAHHLVLLATTAREINKALGFRRLRFFRFKNMYKFFKERHQPIRMLIK